MVYCKMLGASDRLDPRDPDTAENTDVGGDPRSTTGTPRWVKVSLIAAIVLALLVILMLSGVLGEHGPGRHTHSGGLSSPAPSSTVRASSGPGQRGPSSRPPNAWKPGTTMPLRLRKVALTAHVTFSVGWLGAVAAFLALAIVGLTSQDTRTVRAVYLAAQPITWYVLIPFALASLLTGLTSSLASPWGLFRHYWVLFKLVLNVLATIVLLIYTQTVGTLAELAVKPGADLGKLRAPTFLLHSTVALLVLLVATVLAVYKPRGLTRYGRRKQRDERRQRQRAVLVP